MFDNLREQANSSPFYEDEAQFQEAAGTSAAAPRRSSSGRILGMTAPQRFFIVLMLMFTVCILGTLFLLVTGKFGI
ncbi:MAG: hypothetical protein HYR70_07025 [Chloroflexi bacterium]|nr:hypothetical protein [Chloroflexota bacterium]MBI3340915.1 hypothetical protein [Chloroflexota bacterium]